MLWTPSFPDDAKRVPTIQVQQTRTPIARYCAVVVFALATALSPSAIALTQIDFVSDPGELVGGGQTFSLTPTDGLITAVQSTQNNVTGIEIRFAGVTSIPPKSFWLLGFSPFKGTTLLPGNYASAQRWPFQSPKRPGLSIFGDVGSCYLTGDSGGSFTVYEATYGPGGSVLSFAADANQHCVGTSKALHVHVRFNSNIPLNASAPQALAGLPQEVYERSLVVLDGSQSYDPDGQIVAWQWTQISGPTVVLETPASPITRFRAPNVPLGGADVRLRLDVTDNSGAHAIDTVNVHVFDQRDRRTLLTWRSPPGDFIGGGVPLLFTLADGDATFGRFFPLPAVDLYFDGGAASLWTLDFAAPNGAPLAIGTYTNAERFPFQSPGHPGFDIAGSGRGCSIVTGQFTVLEIDSVANPARFGARFVQSCEGRQPALRGTVLFNAIAPGNPVARVSGPTVASPGAVVTLDGSSSSSTGSAIVSYQWRQLGGPPVATSDPTLPQLTFTLPSSPTAPLRFELEVKDEDGLVDVAQVTVGGLQTAVAEIPTLSEAALAILIAILAMSGARVLSARRPNRVRLKSD